MAETGTHFDGCVEEHHIRDVVDENCTAENPVKITFQDVTSASYLIKNKLEYTPCTVS